MKLWQRLLRPTLGWLAVVALLTFPLFTISGAVDMFLKLGDIEGESMDDKHKGEIDVLAWSWGMSQSGTTHVGGGGGAGKANVQDLAITKYIDKSSADLMFNLLRGEHIENGTLTVRKAGGKQLEYFKIELKDIIVTSVSTGGSGGEDRLTENVSLNFGKFKVTYIEEIDGQQGETKTVQWNIAESTEKF